MNKKIVNSSEFHVTYHHNYWDSFAATSRQFINNKTKNTRDMPWIEPEENYFNDNSHNLTKK